MGKIDEHGILNEYHQSPSVPVRFTRSCPVEAFEQYRDQEYDT